MDIVIYGSRRQGNYTADIINLVFALHAHGLTVAMHVKLYDYMTEATGSAPDVDDVIGPDDDFSALMCLSIGGDGTFLRSAAWIGARHIPILGINTGHLGYLSGLSITECHRIPAMLADNGFSVENRTQLQVEFSGMRHDFRPYALNEVAILKKDTASMITAHAKINGNDLATYLGDGLIISTPTGSTGYNLSVGGPIVQPTAPNWVIAPVAAHSLTMRPLVVSHDETITIMAESRAGSFLLSLDGRSISLPAGTELTIRKAPFVTKVVQPAGHNFAATLRSKLLWGTDPR